MKSNGFIKRIATVVISVTLSLGCVSSVYAAASKHVVYSYTYFKHPTISHDSSGQYFISYYNFIQKSVSLDGGISLEAAAARGLSYAPSPSMLYSSWTVAYEDCPDANTMDIRYETKFTGSHIAFIICDASKTYTSNGVKCYSYGDAEIIEQHVNSGQWISIPTSSSRFNNIRVADDVGFNQSSGIKRGDRYFMAKESRYHLIVLEGDPGPVFVKTKSVRMSQTSATMSLGQRLQLSVNFNPENASNKTMSWQSSDPSVVTVDPNGLVTCVGTGKAKITAMTTDGSNKKATCSITGPKAATGVSISGPKNIGRDETIQLYATVKPDNAADKRVSWGLASGSADIHDNGDGTCNVTCKGSGNIKIQATTVTGKTKTYTIKGPKGATGVNISGPKNIGKDETITLSATVKPDNAFDKTVYWGLVNGIGDIHDNGNGTCSVTCTGAGDLRVQATTVTGKSKTFTIKGPKGATGLNISGPKNIGKDETITLSATVKPDNAVDKTVKWSLANGNGEIHDNGNGTCDVKCTGAGDIKVQATTVTGKSKTFTIKGPKAASGVTVSGPKNISKGETITLSSVVKPDNAVDKTVTWDLLNGNGEIHDNGNGTCSVTCTGAGDIRVQAKTVTDKTRAFVIKGPKAATGVSVKASNNKLSVGESAQASATVKPANVIDSSVTWSSENEAIATVSEDGVITAVAPGKVLIFATAHNGAQGKCNITVK